MEIDHAELLKTLFGQHQKLKDYLQHVAQDIGRPEGELDCTEKDLVQFHKDLVAHLALEDKVFYPEVFRILKRSGMDSRPTEIFFAEMQKIAAVVEEFLAKYKTKEDILKNKKDFSDEFGSIAKKLALRVAAEEEGVYMYLA